ncbi:flagellar export chaperone FlgN [Clostridium transplantifaecale]|uniref:flagellar export chaperone FlgN n=1 Tax=Clostridium transplantifaecale TaxID=2479838 RepID=UPI000F63A2ED|nr:flagellar export chaperone FlgN [Clostridium transplantifaecale]
MEKLISFLREYTEFFEQMQLKQQDKLEHLASKDLKQIEETIVLQQAMDKQMENMEKQRGELLDSMGYSGCTFKELIDNSAEEEKSELLTLYGRLGEAIDNVKFINQKAVKMAQTELARMGVSTSGLTGNPSGVYKPAAGQRRTLFEKKI